MNRIARTSRRKYSLPAMLLTMAAVTILPAAATRGASKYVKGYAHIANNTGVADSREGVLPLSSIGTIGESVGATFAGTAQYQLYSAVGGGAQVSGSSSPVAYSTYLSNGRTTQADAYCQIADFFRVHTLDLGTPVSINVKAAYTGTLMPNQAFEDQWNANNPNSPIFTATSTFDLTYGYTNAAGTFLSSASFHHLVDENNPLFDRFGFGHTQPVQITNYDQYIGFQLTLGGLGIQGGGFDFAAAAGGGGDNLAADTADDFFQITVELPPGVSISGHSALVTPVTIPEPSALIGGLATLGVIAAFRRKPRVNRNG